MTKKNKKQKTKNKKQKIEANGVEINQKTTKKKFQSIREWQQMSLVDLWDSMLILGFWKSQGSNHRSKIN